MVDSSSVPMGRVRAGVLPSPPTLKCGAIVRCPYRDIQYVSAVNGYGERFREGVALTK